MRATPARGAQAEPPKETARVRFQAGAKAPRSGGSSSPFDLFDARSSPSDRLPFLESSLTGDPRRAGRSLKIALKAYPLGNEDAAAV